MLNYKMNYSFSCEQKSEMNDLKWIEYSWHQNDAFHFPSKFQMWKAKSAIFSN